MKRKILFLALVGTVIAIGLLHTFTPAHHIFLHGAYRRLSYFPIILGAIWFGVRGGLSLAILSSIAFIPHLLLYIGKGPERYLNELTEVVLYLAAGVVTGFIAGREASLRERYKNLSEKLERAYAKLHQETALLIEAEEQLAASEKFSALGQLAASLAHEVKNPLSSIRGTTEILLDDFPEGHPKREFVEILLKETARLNGTVENVLGYARGRRGRKEDLESLAEVVRRVAKLLKRQLDEKKIHFTLRQAGEADDFQVAGGRVAQVFLNIILNAIDAVEEGGRISVTVSRGEDGFSVVIADNGPGIAAGDRERVFDPFVSNKEGGTGLGLLISRKIVASCGGRITVSEAEGGGGCFTVFFPDRRGDHPSLAGSAG